MKRVGIALAALFFILSAPETALAVVQQHSADELIQPGRLYVQFTESHQSFSAGRTGMEAFDRIANRYSVTTIEKAFPSIDVVAARRSLPPSMHALRRVYVVHYDAMDLPQSVAAVFHACRWSGMRNLSTLLNLTTGGQWRIQFLPDLLEEDRKQSQTTMPIHTVFVSSGKSIYLIWDWSRRGTR